MRARSGWHHDKPKPKITMAGFSLVASLTASHVQSLPVALRFTATGSGPGDSSLPVRPGHWQRQRTIIHS